MKNRCMNEMATGFQHYGGRGITYCHEFNDFGNFVNLVESEIGPRPSMDHSLDRIDNDGNYEPGNIKWSTQAEQMRNCRINRNFTHNGKTQCMSAWAAELGTSVGTLKNRIDVLKWPVSKALDTPFLTPIRLAAINQIEAKHLQDANSSVCNTNGLTLTQFMEKARDLAIQSGEQPKPGRYGKKFPFDKRFAWETKRILGEMIEVNPDKGVYARMPRGYRFACGQEAFSDLSNILY